MLNNSFDLMGQLFLHKLDPSSIYEEIASRRGTNKTIKRCEEFTIQNTILDNTTSRFKALNATRRAAKSTTEVMSHVELCMKYPKSRTVYMGLTLDSITEIAWDVFKEINEANNLGLKFNSTKRIIYYPNGSRTRLFGLDASERQLAKILGQKLRKVSIDEAGSITIDLEDFCFQKVRPALIDLAPNSYLTLLGTCENIPNTYFQKVTEGKCQMFEWDIYRWTAYDNPFIRENWTKEIEDILRVNPKAVDSSKFKTHYLNEWCSDDDLLIIPASRMEWVDSLPASYGVKNKKPDWIYTLAVDLGYNDATAYALIAYSWNLPHAYTVKTFKHTQQDFTDVSNTIKQIKSQFPITNLIVDGANKQGIEEMKKRLGLPEMEIAEKQGKATYLKLLRDDVLTGNLKFIEGENDDLKKEWESLQWKDEKKEKEDDRCQNHISDAVLYGWRNTASIRADIEKRIPKESEPEFEQYLEEYEDERARKEQEEGHELYGSPEGDGFFQN